MSEKTVIFVVVKETIEENEKKVKNIWLFHFFIVYLYCKKEIKFNK